MAERNAEVLEVLLGQIADDREVDGVISEALGVLAQADRCQPLGNAFHGTSRRPASLCCARAASGHAAAASPRRVMNARRFIQSPRRRAAEATEARQDRVPWLS